MWLSYALKFNESGAMPARMVRWGTNQGMAVTGDACEEMLRCWDAGMLGCKYADCDAAAARAAGATVHGDELCIDTAPRESYKQEENVKCNYIMSR